LVLTERHAPRDERFMTLINLLFLCNLDDFVPASGAAENPDLAFGNTEMLRQQFDDRLVGLAFPGRLFDLDYIAITFTTKFFGLGTGLYSNLDFHFMTIISRTVMLRNRERDSDC
jgi:hypothetical protein